MRSLRLRRSAPGLASSSRCTNSIPSSARAVTGPCGSSPTSESQRSSRRSSPPSACDPRKRPARPHRLRRNAGRPTFCRGPVSTFPSRRWRLHRLSRRPRRRPRRVGVPAERARRGFALDTRPRPAVSTRSVGQRPPPGRGRGVRARRPQEQIPITPSLHP